MKKASENFNQNSAPSEVDSITALLRRTEMGQALLDLASQEKLEIISDAKLQSRARYYPHCNEIRIQVGHNNEDVIGCLAHQLRCFWQNHKVALAAIKTENLPVFMSVTNEVLFTRFAQADAYVFALQFMIDFARCTGRDDLKEAFRKSQPNIYNCLLEHDGFDYAAAVHQVAQNVDFSYHFDAFAVEKFSDATKSILALLSQVTAADRQEFISKTDQEVKEAPRAALTKLALQNKRFLQVPAPFGDLSQPVSISIGKKNTQSAQTAQQNFIQALAQFRQPKLQVPKLNS